MSLATLKEVEDAYILQIMDRCKNYGEAAAILGINPSTLFRRRPDINRDNQRIRIDVIDCDSNIPASLLPPTPDESQA